MTLFEQSMLAIVQAVLEWLPVSSEGFLVIVGENVFGASALEAFRLAIYFHLGTAIAVLIKFRMLLWDAVFNDRTLLRLLIVSAAGTAVVGIPLYLLLSDGFAVLNGMWVTLFIGIALLITATMLRYGRLKGRDIIAIEGRSIKDELGLGLAQGFAILPGISRSGLTITYLVLRGFKRHDAFKISFIISLPAVVGAILFDVIYKVWIKGEQSLAFSYEYLVAMIIVVVLGYLMMNLLLKLANRLSFDKICYMLGGVTIGLVITYFAIRSIG